MITLDWDEDDAYLVKEYLLYIAPGLFLWGVCDIHRRFYNSYESFWRPAICYAITAIAHPFVVQYLMVDQELGMKGLAFSSLFTNGVNFFLMRFLMNMTKDTRDAAFFPRRATCT